MFVHLPKEAGWLAEYPHELTAFPRGRHDDQVDSTARMLDWFKQAGSGRSSNAGIWHLYQQQYEAQQAAASWRAARAVIGDGEEAPAVVTTAETRRRDPDAPETCRRNGVPPTPVLGRTAIGRERGPPRPRAKVKRVFVSQP
jgi:hypothetical protein